jgi:putative MATE family efflux protein
MHDLTSGPVGAHLRRQAVPFSLGLVAIFSFEAIDLFFISRLGNAPLAAVSFTFPVIWLIYGLGMGFEIGAASCISRAIGRRDQGAARRLATDTAVLASLVLAIVGLLGLATIDPLFSRLGATPRLMPLIHDYMGIWFWVAPTDACLWTSLAAIRARGNSRLEAKLITLAALLNLVLDPVLIFGLFGFPRMEIRGAALATLLSNGAVLAFTLLYLAGRQKIFANPIAPWNAILASWRHMLVVGVPAIISNAIIPLSNAIVVAMVATYGVEAVAGFGVAMRIEPMVLIPFYALAAVSSPFFGQNFGAGQFGRLFEARRQITRFCTVFGIAVAASMAVLAQPVSGIFTQAENIRGVAVHYLWLVSWAYGAHGLVMACNSAFNGTGRPLPAMLISAARVILLFLPLALLGRHWLGIEGIFLATGVSNLLLALLAFVWLGRHIASHGRAPPPGPSGATP